jgi:hypothetical protein
VGKDYFGLAISCFMQGEDNQIGIQTEQCKRNQVMPSL